MRHLRIVFLSSLIGLAGLALAGCGENPMFRNIVDVAKIVTSGVPDPPIDRQEIANLPYATIAAKLGKGQKAILVLSTDQEGDLSWVAGDGGVLVTREGRLVKTAGFEENLRQTVIEADDPLASGKTDIDGMTLNRTVDLMVKQSYVPIPVTSTFKVMGPEKIEIAGLQFDTVLVKEHNVSQTINWSYDNLYWMDPYDGFVWKSRQYFARDLPAVEIEVLKPAG